MSSEAAAHHNIEGAKVKHRSNLQNIAAEGVSFFTPAQNPPAGTASDPLPDGSHPPKLFTPLRIGNMTLHNRILLSPLCQYSADNGHLTAWHLTHLGGILQRGPGLTMVESTSVTANGRISPEDSGLWLDSQMGPLKQIVEFAHSQGQKIGIQLGHAGRKASTVAPWLSGGDAASEEVNGWPDDVWGPSDEPFNDRYCTPKALSLQQIEEFQRSFVAAVKRALECGFDAIEIHNAHGYLLHSFLSPASNHRTDDYGGSFENRTRLTLEMVQLVRDQLPEGYPLFLRLSATDWLEEADPPIPSWTLSDSIELAKLLADQGAIDLLDVSSGGNHLKQHIHSLGRGHPYQAPFSQAIKEAVGNRLLVTTVGGIVDGKTAQGLVGGQALGNAKGGTPLDAVFVGRHFQKNPGAVFQFADDLEIDVGMPNQIAWAFKGRATGRADKNKK